MENIGKEKKKGEVKEGENEGKKEEEQCERVKGKMGRNSHSGGRKTRNKKGAMLKGLVRCKACGCAMSHHFATRGNKRYRYYVCINAQKKGWDACPAPSLPALQLEQFVVEQIKTLGRDPGVLEDSLRKTQEHLQNDVDELKSQRSEIEATIKDLGRQVGEIASRAGFDEGATRQLAQLQERIRERQEEATDINAAITKVQRRMLEPDELAGAVEAFDPLWNTLPPGQRARLVQLLVERIEYDAQSEAISLTFHPTGIRTLTAQHKEDSEPCPTN